MQNSKLLKIFNVLKGTEKRGFSKFVRSPFFNHKAEVVGLWDYILRYAKEGGASLRKEMAFEQVYPGKGYDDKEMRYVMSLLLKCLEEFLSYQKFKSNPAIGAIYLSADLGERNLEKHFHQATNKVEQKLDQMHLDHEYFYTRYLLELEKYKFSERRKRTKGNNLQELSHSMDVMILTGKLKQSCLLLAHEAVFRADYDYSFLPEMLRYLDTSPFLEIPAVAIYYYYYRAQSEEDDHYFQLFKNTLSEHQALFSQAEVRDLFRFGINYCIKQLNKGNEKYIEEAFNFYKRGLASGVLLQDEWLSRFAYKNIVALGISLENFDWVERFIFEYRKQLNPKYQKANFKYNLAKLYYNQKKFDGAFLQLREVDDSDLLLSFGAKVILLKMYFELEEYDALESLLKSFEALIKRKKILGYHKIHFLGIIKVITKLLKINQGEQDKLADLRAEIENTEVLAEKKWLLKQVALYERSA